MDRMRLAVLGVLAGNEPEATARVEVVPAHPPDFVAALACQRKQPRRSHRMDGPCLWAALRTAASSSSFKVR